MSLRCLLQSRIFTPLHLDYTKVLSGLQTSANKIANHTETIYFDESRQKFFPADSFKAFGAEYEYVAKDIYGGRGISSTAHDLFV